MTPPPLPSRGAVAAFATGAALVAAGAPLLAYAGSLAVFGAAHVLTELRYVDGRFGARTRPGTRVAVLALLAAAVALRALGLAGRVEPLDAYVAELGLVAVLAFVVVPDLAGSPVRAAFAFLLGGAIAAGSWLAPGTTIVLLAILHNATPVGFLAERLRDDPRRGRVIATCGLLFLGVPLLIGSGLPAVALRGLGLGRLDVGFPSAGPIEAHRGVFVPGSLEGHPSATNLFAAVVFLQLLHYGIVIGVLPRLLGTRGASDRPVAPWPGGRTLALGIAALSVAGAVAFTRDFVGTRALYGLLASVHAWIELPVLLLALAPRPATVPA